MNAEMIVKAQILFKDVVIDEGLQFNHELGAQIFREGIFCYVPHMVQMHREIWTEEQLLVFYISKDSHAEVCKRNGKRGKLIFQPVACISLIPYIFEQCVNIVGHAYPLPKEAIPDYYFINPKHFKRVIDLMVFS